MPNTRRDLRKGVLEVPGIPKAHREGEEGRGSLLDADLLFVVRIVTAAVVPTTEATTNARTEPSGTQIHRHTEALSHDLSQDEQVCLQSQPRTQQISIEFHDTTRKHTTTTNTAETHTIQRLRTTKHKRHQRHHHHLQAIHHHIIVVVLTDTHSRAVRIHIHKGIDILTTVATGINQADTKVTANDSEAPTPWLEEGRRDLLSHILQAEQQ